MEGKERLLQQYSALSQINRGRIKALAAIMAEHKNNPPEKNLLEKIYHPHGHKLYKPVIVMYGVFAVFGMVCFWVLVELFLPENAVSLIRGLLTVLFSGMGWTLGEMMNANSRMLLED